MLLRQLPAAPVIPFADPSMLLFLSAGNLAAAGRKLLSGLEAQLDLGCFRVLLPCLFHAGSIMGARKQHLQIREFNRQACSPFLGKPLPNHADIQTG